MTPQKVKAKFMEQGIPVSQWADKNGYRRSDVYRVLNGMTPCKRGLPHEIAVKLGIKKGHITSRLADVIGATE